MVAQNEEVSNITEKKAREIESKVFWKMRTSWYSRIIITGLSEIQRLRQRRLFGEDQPDEEILNMSIEELNFSTNRISRSLKSNDITTVGMLCEKTFDDISHISGFGKKSLEEVVQRLWVLGLHLKEMAVDLNGNEIECLRGYPENIVNIVLKKPMAWERTLYYETVLFHYEKIISQQKDFLAKNTDSDIFLDQRFGLMKFILDKEDELLGYCDDKNLPIDVNKVLEKLENPVEPQMILNISERVMRIYKNALMWCRQVEAVKTVTIFDSVMVAFVNWGRQVLSCFETWIAQVRVGCKEIKELELGKITEDELTGTSLSVKAADEQVLKEFAKISENINLFDQENIVVKFLKVDYDSKDNLIFTLKMFCENMSDEPISLSMHYLIIENGKRVCDDWIDSFDFDGAYYYEVGEAKVVEYDIEMINYQGESGAFVIKFYISIEDEEGMELYDTCELNIIYQYRTGVLLAFESV